MGLECDARKQYSTLIETIILSSYLYSRIISVQSTTLHNKETTTLVEQDQSPKPNDG